MIGRIAAATLLALTGFSASATAEEPIVIGMTTPLSGGVAALGEHEKNGADLAISEINAAGGVLGRKLKLEAQDNQCNPSQGVTSVENLLERNPSAIIGALCSSVTLAVMPVIERAEVPLVVGVSTSRVITETSGVGGNEWAFRINPSDEGLAIALANYLADIGGITSVAFVGEDTDYGRGGHEALKQALEAKGISISSADFYQQNTPDFTALLTRLSAAKPDAVALYAVGADELNILRQYRSFGVQAHLTGRVALDELYDSLVSKGVLDGATSVFPYAANLDTPQNRAFVTAFQERYGELPNYQSFEGYEATKVIADAIGRAGSADPAAVRAALETTDYLSLTGHPIRFDEHNQAHNTATIMRVDGAEIVVEAQAGT